MGLVIKTVDTGVFTPKLPSGKERDCNENRNGKRCVLAEMAGQQ